MKTNIFSTDVQRRISEILESIQMKNKFIPDGGIFLADEKYALIDEDFSTANPNIYHHLIPKDYISIIFSSDGHIMFENRAEAHLTFCRECQKFSFSSTSEKLCPVCKRRFRYLSSNSRIPGWYGHTENGIISEEDAEKHLNDVPDEIESEIRPIIRKLSGKIKYITATEEKISNIKALKEKYPNMQEVIEYFLQNLLSSSFRRNKDITFKPVLLVGSPGCGKTSFTSDVSEIMMGEPCQKIDLGNDVANFTLAGSDPSYSKAKQGIISEAMTGKNRSEALKNPIIHFDELDKINTRNKYSAENVFLALLEKNTAKRFMDNFIGVNIDASGVNYIFTANSLNNIPAPVLNRMKVFQIPDYTHDQLKELVLDYFYEGWISSNDMDPSFLPAVLSDYMKDKILMESNDDPRSIYESITKFFTMTLTDDSESGQKIALFSPEELYSGWKKFRGKRKISKTTWILPKGFLKKSDSEYHLPFPDVL